jgi:uncharacterized protein YecE (DUF72 family)
MSIRVGVGGWTFEPWRGTFYPAGLPHKRELEYASQHLTSIEINGTYYGTQKPASFVRWYEETPEGFVFSLKGSRYTTNRRVLAEAGPSVERFLASGVLLLKEKLGPINWQMLPTKRFEPDDFDAFLKLLPHQVQGQAVRHVVEVRHPSFACPEFIALLRKHAVGLVFADHASYPCLYDVTSPLIYARLQRASEQEPVGYSPDALSGWAKRAQSWALGKSPHDLPRIAAQEVKSPTRRDVFIYMINGFKPKAPAAAMALLERLS